MVVISKNSTRARKGRDLAFRTILGSHDNECDILDFLSTIWDFDLGGVDFGVSAPHPPFSFMTVKPSGILCPHLENPFLETKIFPHFHFLFFSSSPMTCAPPPHTHQTIERCFTKTFPPFSNLTTQSHTKDSKNFKNLKL